MSRTDRETAWETAWETLVGRNCNALSKMSRMSVWDSAHSTRTIRSNHAGKPWLEWKTTSAKQHLHDLQETNQGTNECKMTRAELLGIQIRHTLKQIFVTFQGISKNQTEPDPQLCQLLAKASQGDARGPKQKRTRNESFLYFQRYLSSRKSGSEAPVAPVTAIEFLC